MKSVRRIGAFLKPYWHFALLAPLLMVLEVAMDLLQPRMIERIIDQGIRQLDLSLVVQTGLLMVGLALIGALGGVGCTVFSVLASQGLGTDLRSTLFRRVQALSFGNLDRLETGQLITRLTNDVSQVQEAVSMLLRIMVRAPLMMAGSVVMAIVTSPRLATMLIVLGPFVLAVLAWAINKAFPLFTGVQRKLDELNTVLQENLAGVRVVKAFVRAEHEKRRFGDVNDGLMEQTIRATRTVAVTMPAVMLALNLGVVAAIWFGGVDITVGGMKEGELVAFINYLMRALMSLMFASMLVVRIARAQASAERIQEVLDSEPEVQDRPAAPALLSPQGRVVFENVRFSYDRDEHDAVLEDISFVAEPGQTVAILGATGSGKSTLVHLIPRFYDVTAGRITIDGRDVREVAQASLRRSIGIVLQESVLVTGTIRDNIRYGRPEATDEEVRAAARLANADSFIRYLPQGYDTPLSERGSNLSLGQRQLLSIARAILADPGILVLDEATSSVDTRTEKHIQEAMLRLMEGRTSFVIAHRLSTIREADAILVIHNGDILERGTHEELLARRGFYHQLYTSQFKGR